MPAKLYVVHGSHPCEKAVKRALEMKGIAYKTVRDPAAIPGWSIQGKRIFGQRTVPGIKFEDGEKVIGSTAIMRRLRRAGRPSPSCLRPTLESER